MHPTKPAALAIALAAGLANAQSARYSWVVNDSGSNAATVQPGETVSLWLYVDWDLQGAIGYAGSIFDIVGLEHWDTGEITLAHNIIDTLQTGPGDIQANNDILNIESFQLPPFFNPQFWEGRPLRIYEIEWVPDAGSNRTVRLTDANHLHNLFYINQFGSSVDLPADPSEGAIIHIVPTPAAPMLVALGLVDARRRR